MMIEKATASAFPMPNSAMPDTQSHWKVPTKPGEEGIAAPRLITVVRKITSSGDRSMPSAEATNSAANAQQPQAAAVSTVRTTASRRLTRSPAPWMNPSSCRPRPAAGQAPDSGQPLAAHMQAGDGERRGEQRAKHDGGDKYVPQPRRVRHEREGDREGDDQEQHVGGAINDDGGERPRPCEPAGTAQPVASQHIARPARDDVVDGDAAHDQPQEGAPGQFRRVSGDPAPTQRLERVDRAHQDNCERHVEPVGIPQRAPHLTGLQTADGQPQEDHAERDAHHQSDQGVAPEQARTFDLHLVIARRWMTSGSHWRRLYYSPSRRLCTCPGRSC